MLEGTGRAVQPHTEVGPLCTPGVLGWEFRGNCGALPAISRMRVGSAVTPVVFIIMLIALSLPSSPTELRKLSFTFQEAHIYILCISPEEIHSTGKRSPWQPLQLLGHWLL